MITITQEKDLKNTNDFQFIGHFPKLNNSKIEINGKNNMLICEENVTFINSNITFNGNNSLIYISKNQNNYFMHLSIYEDSIFFIGQDCYINPNGSALSINVSEQKNVIIGNDCLFSFNIWIRTSDPHLIYDTTTKKRINNSKSIFIGDHVWIGQGALILKGSKIGSGSIIGAMSLLSGKTVTSNESWGGNPIKCIKSNISFEKWNAAKWNKNKTKKYQTYDSDEHIYKVDDNTIDFNFLETKLDNCLNLSDKLNIIKEYLVENTSKNRFTIEAKKEKSFFSKLFKSLFINKQTH